VVYKQRVVSDLDIPGSIRGGLVTPAHIPEAEAAGPLIAKVECQGEPLGELHIDRAYVDSAPVRERPAPRLVAKPHPAGNQGRLSKAEFALDFEAMTRRCPGEVTMPMQPGEIVGSPAARCAVRPLSSRCTTTHTRGQQVRIHAQEPLQARLRAAQRTPKGRAACRERVAIEHGLARIARLRGTRAGYRGREHNDLDLRRHIVVNNCYVLDGLWRAVA
jgi:hypothetical protein